MQAIERAVLSTPGSIVISATAGSGKTSLVLQLARKLAERGVNPRGMLYLAYNRPVVEEVEPRLPPGMACKTAHGLGFAALRARFGELTLDPNKYLAILGEVLGEADLPPLHGELPGFVAAVRRLLNAVRTQGLLPNSHALGKALEGIEHFRPDGDRIVLVTARMLHRGEESLKRGVLDYGDMLYFPWKLGLPPAAHFGVVFVDELQDQSPLQLSLSLKLQGPGGRLISVGDPLQAVNRWAGADPLAVGKMRILSQARQFPLSTTWRCPRAHVLLAKVIAGGAIEARKGAPAGRVGTMDTREMLDTLERGDLVLCRDNAPLVGAALALMGRRKKVCFRGRDLSKELVELAAGVQAELGSLDAEAVSARLREHRGQLWAAIVAGHLQEDRETLRTFSEASDLHSALVTLLKIRAPGDLSGVEAAVRDLFSRQDAAGAVVLSSVHRAKGLEAERVFLYEPGRMPSAYGNAEEERCVLFVALTRSKRELYFVGGMPRDPDVQAVLSRLLGTGLAEAS